MFEQIDVYCERVDFSFWAEPVNAVTNAAFLAAAFFAFLLYRRNDARDGFAVALIALMACVGIGSFLFHTLATRWAGLADMIPIAVMIITYYIATMRRVIGAGWVMTGIYFLLLPAMIYGMTMLPFNIGANGFYVPAFIMLIVFAVYDYRHDAPEKHILPLAVVIFAVSLTARIFDPILCGVWPMGTHFLWHICNAIVLYLAFRAYRTNTV